MDPAANWNVENNRFDAAIKRVLTNGERGLTHTDPKSFHDQSNGHTTHQHRKAVVWLQHGRRPLLR
jgi:hypothetical protein